MNYIVEDDENKMVTLEGDGEVVDIFVGGVRFARVSSVGLDLYDISDSNTGLPVDKEGFVEVTR